jgi:TonB family protein
MPSILKLCILSLAAAVPFGYATDQSSPGEAGVTSPPIVILQPPPDYPSGWFGRRIPGKAVVGFLVDPNGVPRTIYTVSCTKPEFGEAAVRCVSRWRFKPGIVNGVRVWFRMVVPINFDPSSASPQLSDNKVYELKEVDVRPAFRFKSEVFYPPALRSAFVTGEAVVGFVVDARGVPRNLHVVSCTRPEFGMAAAAAIAKWSYRPGFANGTPVATHMAQKIKFDLTAEGPGKAPQVQITALIE